MGNVENLENIDDVFTTLLTKLDLPDHEKIDLMKDFSEKSLSQQILMVKIFEGRLKSEQEQIQQRFVESQNKRGSL